VAPQRRWILALALAGSLMPTWAADEEAPAEPEAKAPVEPEAKVRFHGEVRLRGEYQANYQDFDDDGGFYDPTIPFLIPDDAVEFYPYRARVGVETTLAKDVVGMVEAQVGGVAGVDQEQRDPLHSNASDVDLYQANVYWTSVANSNLSMRLGRQELTYGNEFFFGNQDFYNGISFDGYRLRWEGESLGFDFWWAKTNETFEADADHDLFNVALGGKSERGDEFNFYFHYVRMDEPSGTNRTDVSVYGFRWTRMDGGSDHWIWNFEGAWQDGRVGNPLDPATGITGDDTSIAAWGGEGALGYNWSQEATDHRVYAHLYWASGDKDRTDDNDNNFRTLYQEVHTRLGRADLIQGTNVTSLGIAYEGKFGDRHAAGVDLMAFVIARAADTATILASFAGDFDGFGIPATALNAAPNIVPAEDDLGQEFDLWYDYYYTDNLSFDLELSVFLPGDAIAQVAAGQDDPVLRLAGQVRLRF